LLAEIADVKTGAWSPLSEVELGKQLHAADMEIRRAREALRLSAEPESLELFEAMWKPVRELRRMLVAGRSPAEPDWLAVHEQLESARRQFAALAPPAAQPGRSRDTA
jgi:hypothetical protein